MQVGCHSGGANWGCSWGALKGNLGSSVVVLGSLEEKSWQPWGLEICISCVASSMPGE